MSTAWARSSLPSDRIPPKVQSTQPAKPKQKGKQKDAGPPKSKEVLKLETLRDDLRKNSGRERDPKGGCFCQARMHALSSYTPICRACGLILCELAYPNFACPHCGEALLTGAARESLIQSLEAQIAETRAKEDEDRRRAIQQARAAEGAFPTLSAAASRATTPGSGSDSQAAAHPVNQTRKVLSLDSKKGKIKVASYTPPSVSRAASVERGKQPAAPEYKRVPAPPPEVVVPSSGLPDSQRPWANVRGLNVRYVPPSRVG